MVDVGGWMDPTVDHAALDAELNRHGEAGWELVSALDVTDSGKSRGIVALFKRPRA